jgi:16S rRNA (adenine1518-N6/adenine1519-N6)-dimethyltransferase
VKAKKQLGQHFLIDQEAISRISEAIIKEGEGISNVLEIGPGQGVLTKQLLGQSFHLKLVEKDRDMVHILKRDLDVSDEIIIHDDILKLNPFEVFDKAPFVLAGNYPYNISSQIIFWMLSAREIIPTMVGMFQREVANRLLSPHGKKSYGVTSVLTQAFYDGEKLFDLPPESFDPPPKVHSSVIIYRRKDNDQLPCSEKFFKRVVKLCFNQRRKMLSNSLKSLELDRTILQKEVFSKRPEQLSVDDFIALTVLLEKYKIA